MGAKKNGHNVRVYTSHCDPNHCFPETQTDLDVKVYGDWLPRHIFGYLHVVFAILRMIWVTLMVLLFEPKIDVIFCDQVSFTIPLLKFKAKVLFYCHFPDKLLAQRKSFIKKLYRRPIDWAEEFTTGKADCILVNSKFTSGIFKQSFRSIKKDPLVLYPCVAFEKDTEEEIEEEISIENFDPNKKFLLSINRYEEKKNIELAVKAFALLKSKVSSNVFSSYHLVIAGGYDERVEENKRVANNLRKVVKENNIENQVTFLFSISSKLKKQLLKKCVSVVYTPSDEHFGIVPIESMNMEKPVIACNSGGPLESIKNGVTGYLCSPKPEEFAEAFLKLLEDDNHAKELGVSAKERVQDLFSFDSFSQNLNNYFLKLSPK